MKEIKNFQKKYLIKEVSFVILYQRKLTIKQTVNYI